MVLEKTLYFSNDGFAFPTPELCLEYEKKKRALWTAAMKEIPPPEGISLDLGEWMPSSPYRAGTIKLAAGEAEVFLEQLAYLQKLAAFMASD